jgi:hypothetical protein
MYRIFKYYIRHEYEHTRVMQSVIRTKQQIKYKIDDILKFGKAMLGSSSVVGRVGGDEGSQDAMTGDRERFDEKNRRRCGDRG